MAEQMMTKLEDFAALRMRKECPVCGAVDTTDGYEGAVCSGAVFCMQSDLG